MSKPIIIHPSFVECQNFTLDQYWKEIFINCACNKFPRGVRYDNNTHTLYIRTLTGTKSKVEAIDLPEKPQDTYITLIQVFREKLGMYSSYDLQIKKGTLEEIQNQHRIDLNCDWKKLKPRSIKDFMILNYVLTLSQKYKLTIKETKQLLTTIRLGFQFKVLKSEDVDYTNGSIMNINGLIYDESLRVWTTTNSPSYSASPSEKVITQKFNQSIDKFLRDNKSRKLVLK
uniref:Uncharacterized protein n=1 Tax=Marseillevirus LCMAC102 TaxID=2506603 RepID=A0A481YU26_9VIRU|nr:MAG: uncharacterized protein LCMAC102_03350 [Marseillevirus LCMAC102]